MSDTEESRTASLGRKRRQNGDALQVARESDGKRQKLNADGDFIALDSDDNSLSDGSSRESGEVSSSKDSTASSKEPQKDEPEMVGSYDLEDEQPQRQGPPPIDLEAIYPPAMQKWVAEKCQMKVPRTPETVLREAVSSKVKGQPYGKAAKNFLRQWDNGFRRRFPTLSFNELQRLIETPKAWRRPFNINRLKDGSQLYDRMVKSVERNPEEDPAFLLLGWIRDLRQHTPACKAMKTYMNESLRPEWTPIDKPRKTDPATNSKSSGAKNTQPPTNDKHEDTTMRDNNPPARSESDHDSSDDASTGAPPDSSTLYLRNLSQYDQILQARYFRVTDPNAPVICPSCAHPGHITTTCPALTCTHCGSREHLNRHCPPFRKCTRCRQRGHPSTTCTRAHKPAGGQGDECDVCGKLGHAETECNGLWQTYFPDKVQIKKIPRSEMVVSCYNCGKEGHWGDDCESLPDFIKLTHDTWSASNANRYIIGAEEDEAEKKGKGKKGEARDGGGKGTLPSYQAAQLSDWF